MHPDQLTPAGFVERAEPLRGKEPKYTGLRHGRSSNALILELRWCGGEASKGKQTHSFVSGGLNSRSNTYRKRERWEESHSTALLSVSAFDVFPGCSAIVLHLLPPISSVPCLKVLHWMMHYAQTGRLLQTLSEEF